MNVEKQFNLIAEEYDRNRKKFIPCFEDFYKNTTEFIVSNINEPKNIVDLGAGTGLLTYFWYQLCPNSEYMLVDVAEDMLNIAQRRFNKSRNISYQIENYMNKLPDTVFDTVISALSIHHLEDKDKSKLFSRIYERLPKGGFFINYDQFSAGQEKMNRWFDSFWESRLADSGLTNVDIELWKERRKLDRECSVEQEMDMLKNSKFRIVQCVYSYQKFSVIVSIK
ncbi:MAG: class I SAM-dependent methyltransferase [Lachnospiraceae bacterium]|nr:class I SAM-dependent methyltransferase [Lachnospiraceae bacterium]